MLKVLSKAFFSLTAIIINEQYFSLERDSIKRFGVKHFFISLSSFFIYRRKKKAGKEKRICYFSPSKYSYVFTFHSEKQSRDEKVKAQLFS